MIELACLGAVAALAAFQEWRHGRSQDRFQVERDQWGKEREMLLQRIQAPEVAVVQHQVADAVDRPAVNPEDDEDYWKAEAERREAIAKFEQLEREYEARIA
jgi:hypothetical protein